MLFWSECEIFNLKPLISQSSDDSNQKSYPLNSLHLHELELCKLFYSQFLKPNFIPLGDTRNQDATVILCNFLFSLLEWSTCIHVHVWQLVSHWTESCLFLGKILNDDQPLTEYNIEEKGFVVVMVTKVKNPFSFKLVQQNCAWGWVATVTVHSWSYMFVSKPGQTMLLET